MAAFGIPDKLVKMETPVPIGPLADLYGRTYFPGGIGFVRPPVGIGFVRPTGGIGFVRSTGGIVFGLRPESSRPKASRSKSSRSKSSRSKSSRPESSRSERAKEVESLKAKYEREEAAARGKKKPKAPKKTSEELLRASRSARVKSEKAEQERDRTHNAKLLKLFHDALQQKNAKIKQLFLQAENQIDVPDFASAEVTIQQIEKKILDFKNYVTFQTLRSWGEAQHRRESEYLPLHNQMITGLVNLIGHYETQSGLVYKEK